MSPKHPCPNCAALRSGPDVPCPKCQFPNHQSTSRQSVPQPPQRRHPLRFHLGTLFACVTISAIVFATLRAFGTEGFWFATYVGAGLSPLIEFMYRFWRNCTRPLSEISKLD